MSERLSYLDSYRGYMIMWVLVVHISLNYGYIQYGVPSGRYNMFTLLSFYMITFYFAAGYFFNNKRDFRELFIRKSRSLVVPWIIYTIFGILVYLMYCYVVNEDIKINFYSIINSWALSTNTPMWFLGSLFFSTMATWFMINWSNRGGYFLLMILMLAVLIMIPNRHFPFGVENIILGTLIMNIGYQYKQFESVLIKRKYYNLVLLSLFFAIWVLCPCEYWMDRNVVGQGNIFLCLCYGILGSFVLLMVAKFMPNDNIVVKSFEYIGKNSLVLFAFHRPVLNYVIEPSLKYFSPGIGYYAFLSVCLISIMFLYICFLMFAKRYCRILL